MFKKHEDGTYSFSTRFWTYAVIATTIIIWIGWRTQTVANRTEVQGQETTQFAKQTNDCLSQLIATLKDRTELNAKLDDLVNARSAVLQDFVASLSSVSPSLSVNQQTDANRAAITKFFVASRQIDHERADLLAQRAAKPYPDPTCGNKLPGE